MDQIELDYRAIFAQLPQPALVVERDGRVVASNRAARRLFGEGVDTFAENLTRLLYPREETAATLDATTLLERLLATPTSLPMRFCAQVGEDIPLEVRAGRLGDRVLLTLYDQSAQQERERQTQNQSEIFNSFFHSSLVGLYRTRISDGKMLTCNPHLAEMFGYASAEEMMAEYQAPAHYVNLEDRKRLIAELKATGEVKNFVAPLYRKDGQVRWFEYSGTIYPEQGYLQGVVTDVTERHEAQAELRLAASVFDGTTEGILITDADANILRVNRAFTEITGYREEEVVGKNPRLLRSDRHDRRFYQNLWHTLLESGRWSGEIWNRRRDGTPYLVWQNISALRDDEGQVTQFIGIFSDITERKESEERIARLAHYDALTNLPNRWLFQDRCQHALLRAAREGYQLALLFLDLDGFKDINDGLGHPVGDKVLQAIAERLLDALREEDTIARLGGDEFVVVIEDVGNARDVAVIADKLLKAVRDPIEIAEHCFHLSASIGISLFPADGVDTTTLVRNADAAMYRAKEQGRNNYQFYTSELTTSAFERVLLENQLRHALENNELSLVYQPQFDLQSGNAVGIEALLRWHHPKFGNISPDRFIPTAERSGLILPIGEWVLENACRQARAWTDAGLPIERLAINVSGAQIQRSEFVEIVKRALSRTGFDASRLELEVTESFIMTQADQGIRTLEALRTLGVTLAIDDFGTGYSSLAYLKQLPIDRLKIDKSFVRDVPGDANDLAITRAVIALAKSLQLQVIAEGVETEQQQAFLVAEGCDEAQGYLFSRPVEAETVPSFFA
ncbi:MAG: hypothetical protein Kow006_23530 [Gammaproteobacteria bacterium]